MNTTLISVIIPAYNVENFIKECIDSVVAQTYTNLEIIVIDDGSPDASGSIADLCAENDDRIIVVHTENGGVSSARNAGLEIATGEYVVFIDSDDRIEPDCIEYFQKLIDETDSDVAVSLNMYNPFNMKQVNADRFEIYSPTVAMREMYLSHINVAVWNKIYRRSFIETHQLRFLPELWFGEGFTFNITCFQHAASIGVGRRRVYYQQFNPESAMRKFNLATRESGFKALTIQKEGFTIEDREVNQSWDFHYRRLAFSICREITRFNMEHEYKSELKKYGSLSRRRLLQHLFLPTTSKTKLMDLIILFSPRIAARVAARKRKGGWV
jgi:glycosyltransferase involved in cell wall biosynthesis